MNELLDKQMNERTEEINNRDYSVFIHLLSVSLLSVHYSLDNYKYEFAFEKKEHLGV